MAKKLIPISFELVKERADLPTNLVPGKAYFVAKEGLIIIDHGAGPVEYGNTAELNSAVEDLRDLNSELATRAAALEEENARLNSYLMWNGVDDIEDDETPDNPDTPDIPVDGGNG